MMPNTNRGQRVKLALFRKRIAAAVVAGLQRRNASRKSA